MFNYEHNFWYEFFGFGLIFFGLILGIGIAFLEIKNPSKDKVD